MSTGNLNEERVSSKTILTISVKAEYSGAEDVPPEESDVDETVILEIPILDPKYVVFPKVMEGVTAAVVKAHRIRVNAYLRKRADEKAQAEQDAIKPPLLNLNGREVTS